MTGPATRGPAARRPARRPERPEPLPVSPQRYRRRRLAAALIALLLLVGLGLTARVLLYDTGLADVEDVQVGGATTIPVEDLLAAAAVPLGGPLAAVDTDEIADRVARLPAVESAGVERDWPHTVIVAIRERTPVAVTLTPDGPALVDRAGVVYRGVATAGLPRLTFAAGGPDDPSTLAAIGVLVALPDAVRAQVLTAGVIAAAPGAPRRVILGLTENRQVRWGPPDRSADKVAALVPLLTQRGRVYDVASPDLPTVRR